MTDAKESGTPLGVRCLSKLRSKKTKTCLNQLELTALIAHEQRTPKDCLTSARARAINMSLERQESWIISDWVKVPFEKV